MSSTPAPKNPRKRGASSSFPPASVDRKRTKLQDARTIAVQDTEQALQTGELDVMAFVRSREFEIDALEKAMSNSKRANNKRAFQLVPRDMRRRTASHNVKRVPKRLRARASREMKADNTPTVTARRRKPSGHLRLRRETAKKLHKMAKKKDITAKVLAKTPANRIGVNKLREPPRPRGKFRKRQKEKTWLPTHIWHAKRARMTTRWRFAIAETPAEKSYRPTHRASGTRGCIAWDESYYSTVMLKGEEEHLKKVLAAICPQSESILSRRVIMGARACKAWAYRVKRFPARPIAPIEVIWCVPDPKEEHPSKFVRKLFIRIHPSSFLMLWQELLSLAKPLKVTVEDLRFEIGSIEITGPAATDALMAVLSPTDIDADKDSPSGSWRRLQSLTNPSSLPLGALLAFDMSDPRLRFPPRLPEDKRTQEEKSRDIFELCSTWPVDETQPPSSLFLRGSRTASAKLQSSQKRINKRKGMAVPGEYPTPLPTDPKVPIILIASRRPPSSGGVSGAIGSWTILMPWKWVQPVWYGIMHSSSTVRFGGLQELHQVAYENGIAYFPDDFPGTDAGAAEEERKGNERKESWGKRPPGKRVEWGTLRLGENQKGELGSGFLCDWEWLVSHHDSVIGWTGPLNRRGFAWDFLLGLWGEALQDSLKKPWTIPTTMVRDLPTKGSITPPTKHFVYIPTINAALFTVRITYVQRGTPLERARIYSLPRNNPELKEKWKSLLTKRKKPNREPHLPLPDSFNLIGFVTTGNFNLKEGKGVAIGSLGFRATMFRNDGGDVEKICIVRDVGSTVGRLARWEIL